MIRKTESHCMASTTALVLETNNLRGNGDSESVIAGLERLFARLSAQTLPLSALNEVVLTHDGLDPDSCARIERAARRPVRFVDLLPDTGYYEAKNVGFDATTADIVAFADADCWPEPAWLERLLAPFSSTETRVVAGRTTYRDDILGIAATSIDFMYFDSPFGREATRNFYANNVAFRRDVFAAHRYRAAPGIYRGHCQRLGLELSENGIPIRFVSDARTIHRFPDGKRELLQLRFLRGADTVEMAPHLGDSVLSPPLRWLGHLGTASALGVLAVRLGCSARALGHQSTSELRGFRRLAGLSALAALSAADAAGAVGRSTFGKRFGVHDGGLRENRLHYHGDHDRLGAAPVVGDARA